MKRRLTSLCLILPLLAGLAGCAGDAPVRLPFLPTPTTAPTPTATLPPTPTAVPSPTPSPTPIPAARIEQADWQLFLGDYETARLEYQTAFDAASDDETKAAALVGLGRAQLLAESPHLALIPLRQAVQDYSDTYHGKTAYYFLGETYSYQQNYADAARAYESFQYLRPGILDALLFEKLGNARLRAGNPLGAVEAYQAALLAEPPGDEIRLKISIGRAYTAAIDYNNAIRIYAEAFDQATSDYDRATLDYLLGNVYLAMGYTDQAHARFQDAVTNFPRSYDTYQALVYLVNAGIPVDELNRGLIDYFAGQYGYAIEAFNRYMAETAGYDGTALYYTGLALRTLDQPEKAIQAWEELIDGHPGDRFWSAAYEEIAYTQWGWLNDTTTAAQTLLTYVDRAPAAADAATQLYEAARIMERGGNLAAAAEIWQRLMDTYPSQEISLRGLFLAGISYYRLGDLENSLAAFQRHLILAPSPVEQSAAYFWMGKIRQAQGDADAARSTWQQAAAKDPTGYYSERARDLLENRPPFYASATFDLAVDLPAERVEAAAWLRQTFALPPETSLEGLGELAADPRLQRANLYWDLGLYETAREQIDPLLGEISSDPAANFRLLPWLLEKGFYRSAILTSRQILTLAGMDDFSTFLAPAYFNHIRFGVFFKDLVLQYARAENLNPLLLASVIRQESLFEGFAESGAGARGLMQIMPATGQEIANSMGWPANFTPEDLYRPLVSIRLGARYLNRQITYFDGDIMAALTAYNAGPGNTQIWKSLTTSDPDLFFEIVRINETRQYITHIAEFLYIYRNLYERNP